MLVEIFEGVFVRADLIRTVKAKNKTDCSLSDVVEVPSVVVTVEDRHTPDHISEQYTGSGYSSLKDAQQAAREIKERVNTALERGRR